MQVSGQLYASAAVPTGTHSVGADPDTVHALEIEKNTLMLTGNQPPIFRSSAGNTVAVPITLFLFPQGLT